MTHKEFSDTDAGFREACREADTEPTMRQASKYRRKMGKAYKHKTQKEKKQ